MNGRDGTGVRGEDDLLYSVSSVVPRSCAVEVDYIQIPRVMEACFGKSDQQALELIQVHPENTHELDVDAPVS